jgi:hypothetical protein
MRTDARLKKVAPVLVVLGVMALAAIAWILFEQRPGAALDRFERDVEQRVEAAKPKAATAETFRATVCAASPCVLVEVGGLAFLVGAGDGAADRLAARGLLRADLDAVLVNDISLASVEGLARIQRAGFARGRREPLPVFGPDGLLTVVDGVNLVLAASGGEGARLQVGAEGEDQGLAGKIVFDSGVVTIRGFAASGGGRVYRIDDGRKSLIVASCTARPDDILSAARGAKVAAAILAIASPRLLEIESKLAQASGLAPNNYVPACMTPDEAVQAVEDARLAGGLLAPLIPVADGRIWAEVATIPKGLKLAPAPEGALLDLTGDEPTLALP